MKKIIIRMYRNKDFATQKIRIEDCEGGITYETPQENTLEVLSQFAFNSNNKLELKFIDMVFDETTNEWLELGY
jgi:hypothetical protein